MSEKNIYQRLSAVMKDVYYIQKEDKKVNGQYTFVSHDAVTAKMSPAFVEHGIMPVVSVKVHAQDGNRTSVTTLIRFVNVDKPEDFVEIEAFGYGIDNQDKGPGKAISYAFKYGLLKMFCLETGDDPEKDSIPHDKAVSAPKTLPGANLARSGAFCVACKAELVLSKAGKGFYCPNFKDSRAGEHSRITVAELEDFKAENNQTEADRLENEFDSYK